MLLPLLQVPGLLGMAEWDGRYWIGTVERLSVYGSLLSDSESTLEWSVPSVTPTTSALYVTQQWLLLHLDTGLWVLDHQGKQHRALKGIHAVVVTTGRILLGKRNSIQVFSHAWALVQDIPWQQGMMAGVSRGDVICMADAEQYLLLNLATASTIPLFPYNRSRMTPLIVAITQGEFLLLTSSHVQHGLGVFVTRKGEPTRGTLEWDALPSAMAYAYPYVIALFDNGESPFVTVHNVLNQKLIETVPLPSSMKPVSIVTSTNNLLPESDQEMQVAIVCREGVLGVSVPSLDGQIQNMLKEGNVQDAVSLAEQAQAFAASNKSSAATVDLAQVYTQAALASMAETMFEDALEYLKKAQAHPLSVCMLFPDIELPQSPQLPAKPLSEKNETIVTLVGGYLSKNYPKADKDTQSSFGDALIANAKEMMVKYLVYYRGEALSPELKSCIDGILLRHYAASDPSNFLAFVENGSSFDLQQSIDALIQHKHYYSAGLLYKKHGDVSKALELWTRVTNGDTPDPSFPGESVIIDCLTSLPDADLVIKYSQTIMERDPVAGIRIFVDRKVSLDGVDQESLMAYIKRFGREPLRLYLESAIRSNPTLKKDLTEVYLQDVLDHLTAQSFKELETMFQVQQTKSSFVDFLKSIAMTNKAALYRTRLLSHLQMSQASDLTSFLKPIRERLDVMLIENAMLYEKEGDPDSALKLYIDLRDFVGAETLCLSLADEPMATRVFRLVKAVLARSDRDQLAAWSVRWIVLHSEHFDILQMMTVLPKHWNLGLLFPYLARSLSTLLSESRESRIVKSLSKGHHLYVTHRIAQLTQQPPVIAKGQPCDACGIPIDTPSMAANPTSNLITHVKCHAKT